MNTEMRAKHFAKSLRAYHDQGGELIEDRYGEMWRGLCKMEGHQKRLPDPLSKNSWRFTPIGKREPQPYTIKKTVRKEILKTLQDDGGWVSTTRLTEMAGSTCTRTVRRAMADFQRHGIVEGKPVENDPYGMKEWRAL